MNKSTILFPLLACLVLGCNNAADNAKNTEKKQDTLAAGPAKEITQPAPPPMDSATTMQKYTEYMTPGGMQKLLATYSGTWKAELTMWMDPSKPPMKATGTIENKMIMGDRYQMSEAKSVIDGMASEGMAVTGFDNAKKMFVCTWIDNAGTGIMYLQGTWDEATRTINYKGTMTDPATGKDLGVRETLKLTDSKNQFMEMYVTGADGKEYKSMEITYTKK